MMNEKVLNIFNYINWQNLVQTKEIELLKKLSMKNNKMNVPSNQTNKIKTIVCKSLIIPNILIKMLTKL